MALDPSEARAWLERWDRQQERHLPERDRRFSAMFGVLEAHLGPSFAALDLACGPGSLSARLLDRFPSATVTAVDFDPVLLGIGRAARPAGDRRLQWAEADLRTSDWMRHLPRRSFDAVLSTTALHWLSPENLARLYRDLAALIRAGGVFLNGDEIRSEAESPAIRALHDRVRDRARAGRTADASGEDWDVWWTHAAADPALAEWIALRRSRFPAEHGDEPKVSLEAHSRALRDAGFSDVGVIWQSWDDRILLALR